MKEADPFDEETDESWSEQVRNDIHTQPFNFSGSPTLSVPCGFSADGLPLSVQFVGRRLSESVLCRIGHAYEQATPWRSKHPVIWIPHARRKLAERGIRTLDGLLTHTPLAGVRLRPLGHLSGGRK